MFLCSWGFAQEYQFQNQLELAAFLKIGSLPTSQKGQLSFEDPFVRATFEVENNDNQSLIFILKGSDSRDAISKKFQVESEKLAASIKLLEEQELEIQMGLIGNPWNEASEEIWDFSFWTYRSRPLLERYKYLPTSDLGLNINWQFSTPVGLNFSVTNGEASQQAESGPRKEVQIIFNGDVFWGGWALGYVRGAYDDFDSTVNLQERTLLRATFDWSPFVLSLEAFRSKDVSGAFAIYRIAENVDLSALTSVQSIQGEGGSVILLYEINEKWSAKLREDYVQPAKDLADVDIHAHMIGVSRQISTQFSIAGLYSRTDLGERHSLMSRTMEDVELALHLEF